MILGLAAGGSPRLLLLALVVVQYLPHPAEVVATPVMEPFLSTLRQQYVIDDNDGGGGTWTTTIVDEEVFLVHHARVHGLILLLLLFVERERL